MTKQLNRKDAVKRIEEVIDAIHGDDEESLLLEAALWAVSGAVHVGALFELSKFLFPFSGQMVERLKRAVGYDILNDEGRP